MLRLLHTLIFSGTLLLPALNASAGIRISVAEDLAPGYDIMVKTDIINSGLHGSHQQTLGISFLRAGQSETLPVLATLPLLYEKVVATALHPAYHSTSVSSEEAPNLIRTVNLPPLKPRSWRYLLDSGAPVKKGGVGITAGAVNDHFRIILRDFLPAFDRAGQMEDLRRQLPLLRQLATFAQTPKALQNSLDNMQQQSTGDAHRYAELVKRAEGEYRVQLLRRLQEIEGWLSLDRNQRLPMHDWIENFHRPGYVFTRIMQDADRQIIYEMLRQSEKPGYLSQHSWVNRASGIRFSFALTTKTGGRYNPGYRTVLITDLNPRLGLDGNTAYLRKCFPNFVKDPKKGWQLE